MFEKKWFCKYDFPKILSLLFNLPTERIKIIHKGKKVINLEIIKLLKLNKNKNKKLEFFVIGSNEKIYDNIDKYKAILEDKKQQIEWNYIYFLTWCKSITKKDIWNFVKATSNITGMYFQTLFNPAAVELLPPEENKNQNQHQWRR